MSRQADVLERILLEGESLLREGRFAEGEQRARAVLSEQPRNAVGHCLLGLSALMQERHAEALDHVGRAIRLDRVNARYHFLAALCLAPLQRTEEAITSYRRALQYRPGFVEARANLGYLLEHAGRLQEAAECYRRAVALDPSDWGALTRLGYCERVLGRPEVALEVLGGAVARNPRSAATLNEMALALLQMGRAEEAIARLREAVAAEPDFAAGWANLCKLLYVHHLEAVEAAEAAGVPVPEASDVVASFDRLLAFDPGNAEFRYLRDSLAGVRVERPPDAYVESFFDRFAPRFEARVAGELRYSGPETAARFLAPWLAGRSGLRVADLGCGTGLSGAVARAHAGRLAGVDLSAAMLDIARGRSLYDELAREEIGDWLVRQPEASLDLVLALDVFIYVGALDRVLAAAAAALAPDGRLAFTVEDLDDAQGDFALGRSGRYAHSRRCVEDAAGRAGLRAAGSEAFDIRHEGARAVRATLYAFDKPA